MLTIGDYVVKAREGVCKVEKELPMMDYAEKQERPYYMLCPVQDVRVKIYVQVREEYGDIRPVMNKKTAVKLIEEVNDIAATRVNNEKDREQIYKDALNSGDPRALVAIIKSMYIRGKQREKQGKKITSVDERYFRLAEKALYSELGFVLGKENDEVREIIMKSAERRRQRKPPTTPHGAPPPVPTAARNTPTSSPPPKDSTCWPARPTEE